MHLNTIELQTGFGLRSIHANETIRGRSADDPTGFLRSGFEGHITVTIADPQVGIRILQENVILAAEGELVSVQTEINSISNLNHCIHRNIVGQIVATLSQYYCSVQSLAVLIQILQIIITADGNVEIHIRIILGFAHMAIHTHGVDVCLLAHSLDGYSIVGHGEGVGAVAVVGVVQLLPLTLGVVDIEGIEGIALIGSYLCGNRCPGSGFCRNACYSAFLFLYRNIIEGDVEVHLVVCGSSCRLGSGVQNAHSVTICTGK